MAETHNPRKLSVADTLAQATSALEAHRVWMKRRFSTAVAPLTESAMEEEDALGSTPPLRGRESAWEDTDEASTIEHAESIDLKADSPSEGPALASAPPPNTKQWLELLKQRKKASSKVTPVGIAAGLSDSVQSHQRLEMMHDVWNGSQSSVKLNRDDRNESVGQPQCGEIDSNLHGEQPMIQKMNEFSKGKPKKKRYSKATIVPSVDVGNASRSKGLPSVGDVFISPNPDHTLPPVVPMNVWGSMPVLDKANDTEPDLSQESEADGKVSLDITSPVDHHDEVLQNGMKLSETSRPVTKSFASDSEHLQSLKAASTGRIIPVSPAPQDQTSSYDLQKQSKLSAADAAGEILDIKISETPETTSDLKGVRLPSAKQRALADVKDMPEAKLQSVIPNAKGAHFYSVSRSQLASLNHKDIHTDQMDVELKAKSIQSHCENRSDAEVSVPGSSRPLEQENLDVSQPVFKGEEKTTIPFPTELTIADANSTQNSSKDTADTLPEPRKGILKEISHSQLKALQLEKVIEGSNLVGKLPPGKLQSPQSPLLSDLSLSHKRRREPPSYTIHQLQRSNVLAPPCPAFGVEQPTESEVLMSLSKRQALSSVATNMAHIAHPTYSLESPSALRSDSQKSLSVGEKVCTPARTVTKTDDGDRSFRMQSTLQSPEETMNLQEVESAEDEAPAPSHSNGRSAGMGEPPLAMDTISICEMPPGPGPLHMAAKAGNLRRVQTLLRQGHDVDMPDHEGRSPLMYCIHSLGVHLSCADALIKEGANLNKQASDGSTAMHLAASVGAVSLIELMILNGASAKVRDFDGRLPLHWATTPRTTKSITLLMKYCSVDVNTTDDAGMTPLMWAAYNSNLTVVAYLLEQGADCEEKDKDGYTAMHWAIHKDSTLCLQLLLKPDMTYFKDSRGRTVMHMAAEVGAMAACDVILKLRPDAIHDTDKKDRTPLHYAAACSRVDVCALLLDRGADATQKDAAQKTPLDYARSKKLDYVVALLTCHGTAVADFARASRSTSVSSFLSHAVSFSELMNSPAAASEDSRSSDNVSSTHRNLLSAGRGSKVAPAGEVFGDTSTLLSVSQTLSHASGILGGEEDISLYGDLDGNESFNGLISNGGLLGRFTTDKHDPVQHFYFWLKPKTNSICWAREHQRKFAKEAKVLEIHEGPSNTVKQSPIFSPSDLHRYVFWVASAEGVLDLFAYNQEAYLTWIKAIDKLAKRNAQDELELKENRSRSRPASSYTLRSSNSVAPMNTACPNSAELHQQTTASSDIKASELTANKSSHTVGSQAKSAVHMFITSTPVHAQSTAASPLHVSTAECQTSPTRMPQLPVQFLDDVI